MKNQLMLVAACAAAISAPAFAGPFDQFKGKMKEGMYDYKMSMEMPGMPAGMGKTAHTFKHCVTHKDIEEGSLGKGKDGKGMENCEIKDMNMSGNTATYTMVCKGGKDRPAMTANNKITFGSDNFVMDMKMAMDQGGQMMNMTQHMEGQYIGPCTK